MPTRRIDDDKVWDRKPCDHPEHNPPSHMVYQPGTYEHECPGCGRKFVFHVDGVRMRPVPKWDLDGGVPNQRSFPGTVDPCGHVGPFDRWKILHHTA